MCILNYYNYWGEPERAPYLSVSWKVCIYICLHTYSVKIVLFDVFNEFKPHRPCLVYRVWFDTLHMFGNLISDSNIKANNSHSGLKLYNIQPTIITDI